MKYRVTGSNEQTGARMVLEFEAPSKAAAERKACHSGMNVNHAEPILDGICDPPRCPKTGPDGRPGTGGGMIVKLAVLVAVVAVAYMLRAPLMQLIHH